MNMEVVPLLLCTRKSFLCCYGHGSHSSVARYTVTLRYGCSVKIGPSVKIPTIAYFVANSPRNPMRPLAIPQILPFSSYWTISP